MSGRLGKNDVWHPFAAFLKKLGSVLSQKGDNHDCRELRFPDTRQHGSRSRTGMQDSLDRGWQHAVRRHIASKILECAKGGDRTLGRLTEAGRVAAKELCSTYGV